MTHTSHFRAAVLLLALSLCVAIGADVTFVLRDWTGNAQTNAVTLTPTAQPGTDSSSWYLGPPITVSPVGGTATFTGLAPGAYRVTFAGISRSAAILVPDTSSTYNSIDITTAPTNTPASGLVSYSAAASDARYQFASENLTNWSVISTSQLGTASSSAPALDHAGASTGIALAFAGPHGNLRGLTHPNVIQFPTNWAGHQYWLSFSGTTNQTAPTFGPETEDIHVYAGADLANWPHGKQLHTREEFNAGPGGGSGWTADPELYYDDSAGLLRCLWMGYRENAGNWYTNWLYTAHTSDGTNWSAPVVLREWTNGINAAMAGPQVVRMADGTIRLYAVDDRNYSGTNRLWYVTSPDTSGTNWTWGSPVTCTLSPVAAGTATPWHFDMMYLNERYIIAYGTKGAYPGEIAYSDDGETFYGERYGAFEFPSMTVDEVDQQVGYSLPRIYKPALVPVAGPGQQAFNAIIGVNGNTNADKWELRIIRNVTFDDSRLAGRWRATNNVTIGTAPWLTFGNNRYGLFSVYEHLGPTTGGGVHIGAQSSTYGSIGFGSAQSVTNRSGTIIRGNGSYLLQHYATDGGWQVRQNGDNIRGGFGQAGGFFVGGATDNTVPAGAIAVTNGFWGSGANVTNIAGSNLVQNAILNGLVVRQGGPTNVLDIAWDSPGSVVANGAWRFVDAGGDGANLTNMNAANLATGTVPDARMPRVFGGISNALTHSTLGTNVVSEDLRTVIQHGGANTLVVTNGRVGIGKASPNPSYTLDVSGGIYLSGLLLSGSRMASGTDVRASSAYPFFWSHTGSAEMRSTNYMLGMWGTNTSFTSHSNVHNVQVSGTLTASNFVATASPGFIGGGSLISDLNASALSSGTISPARMATNAASEGRVLTATSATTAEWAGASWSPVNLASMGTNVFISPTNGNLQRYTLTNATWFSVLDWNTNNTETIRLELTGSNYVSWASGNLSNSVVLYPTNRISVLLLDRAAGTNLWWASRLR